MRMLVGEDIIFMVENNKKFFQGYHWEAYKVLAGSFLPTRSINFCDKLYVWADVFEGRFFATSNTIKNQYI